jgi:ketosteroid isomerase-like protein
MKHLLILVGLLAASSAMAGGQATGRTVPTVTRNVLTFTELENEWADAVQKHDTATLDKLVADRFEVRSSAAPGVPTARDESLKQSLALAPFKSAIGQMAVHEYGDLMVVSFLWKIDAPKAAGLAKNVFVVDTWKRNGDNWQVLVRYAAPVDATAGIPGALKPSAESLQKKI